MWPVELIFVLIPRCSSFLMGNALRFIRCVMKDPILSCAGNRGMKGKHLQ